MSLKSVIQRFTPNVSRRGSENNVNAFTKAAEGKLFPKTNPLVDGEDCLHDCETCTIEYPAKFSIDEEETLYGHVSGWSTHLIVATGKTDWVRDVSDEPGSIMEAVEKGTVKPTNGTLMLSASNMPIPHHHDANADPASTNVLLLPAFNIIEGVTPALVPDLIQNHISRSSTNTTPLRTSIASLPSSLLPTGASDETTTSQLLSRSCPHRYLILLCSQKTRDARCGQSAPLLRREFERHLRPLGLYRDSHDERPGGCGIYFISHVGGHKFSANLMIYRRAGSLGTVVPEEQDASSTIEEGQGEAAQCIWIARVRPEDCENIVRYTILQGKVVKPERQLRGGFDRGRKLASW